VLYQGWISTAKTSIKKITVSKNMKRRAAGLVSGFSRCNTAPPCPMYFTIIATDGSHIDVDRYQSTNCCLINIGSVMLSYGEQPTATLNSYPDLRGYEEKTGIQSNGMFWSQPVEGALLGVERSVEKLRKLVEMAVALTEECFSLALLDGSLVLWSLAGQTYPAWVFEDLLKNGFLNSLDKIKKSVRVGN